MCSSDLDFTFVHNAVHANLLAARREQPINGEVINVGCGRRVSLNQLVAEMSRILGRHDLKPAYAPARAGDVRHSLADLTRAREWLGYAPIVDVEPGLESTLAWYRSILGPAT